MARGPAYPSVTLGGPQHAPCRRTGPSGRPEALSDPRHRSRTGLRRPDDAGVAHLRDADGPHHADRRRSAVVQVRGRRRHPRNRAQHRVLHARHQATRHHGSAGRARRRPLPPQPDGRRRTAHPLLCRGAADHPGRSRAGHAVRGGHQAAAAHRRTGAGARRAAAAGAGAAGAPPQPHRAGSGAGGARPGRGRTDGARRASFARRWRRWTS